MDKVFHFSVAYIVRPEISISVEFLCCPASDPKGRTIRKLMGGGGGSTKNPPPHNFSNRPSLIKRNFRQVKVLHV